jgi:O-antigen/teichoic acid export membrane protein
MVLANYLYLLIAYAYCIGVVLSTTKRNQRKFEFSNTVRKLMAFGAPLGVSNSFSNFTGQIVNLLIARFVSLDLYGLYSVAKSASGFLSYAVDPIKAMLLPAYSRIAAIKNSDLMKSLCIQTTRYETAIVLPAFLFFIVFATPFVTLLYGTQYAGSGIMLSLMAAAFLPIGLATDALTTFLMSSGFTKFVGSVSLVSSASLMLVAILAVPTFGLIGFLIASIFSFVPGYLILVSKAKSALGLEPPLAYVRPLYYALIFTGAISIGIVSLPLPAWGTVLLGLGLVPLLFIIFSGLFRAIELADFDRLRSMLATQSVVPRFIGPLIGISERLVRYFRRD